MWHFFLNRTSLTWLILIATTVAGTIAIFKIPKESSPEVIIPIGMVTTVFPGASAEDMSTLVTARIENAVASVENIEKITSSSYEGLSMVTAQFVSSADVDKSINDLKKAVDAIQRDLPEDAEDPLVQRVSVTDAPVLVVSIATDTAGNELIALAKRVEDAIEAVPGVSRVDRSGIADRTLTVAVNPSELTYYNLTLNDVVNAIRAGHARVPLGTVTIDASRYAVSLEGAADTRERLAALPITNAITIADVAEVRDGGTAEETYSRISEAGTPAQTAFTLAVYKQPGGDIRSVGNAVRTELDKLKANELGGLPVVVTYDAAKDIEKDLAELIKSGMITMVLVTIALILTIGTREAIVAAISVPLSFTIAFIGILLTGNTINFVSLFSLILAIGILVDSGIVVAEAMNVHLARGKNVHEAGAAALREYASPLVSGTLTTIAVFVPLFFLSGIMGKFVASIPYTLIFVLVASIVAALAFVPLLMKVGNPHHSDTTGYQSRITKVLQTRYRTFLEKMLTTRAWKKRLAGTLVAGIVIVFIIPFTPFLKVVFFPPGDSNLMFIEIDAPQGTSLAATDQYLRAVEEFLYDIPEITSFTSVAGAYGSFRDDDNAGRSVSSHMNITVRLTDEKTRTRTVADIDAIIRERMTALPKLEYTSTSEQGGPPSGAPIVVKLVGKNLDDLAAARIVVERELARIPGAYNVSAPQNDTTGIAITPDRAALAQLGLTPIALAGTLRTALAGMHAATIAADGEDIDIRVELSDTHPSIDTLLALPIATPVGTVLAGSLTTLSLAHEYTIIRRENQETLMTVSAYTTPGANAVEVGNAFLAKVPSLNLPQSVRVVIGGENEDINKSFSEMGLALIAGMVLMLGILVYEFNSFRYAFMVLSIVPLTLIGVFIGLVVMQQPLSFTSLLGVIALAGVIVNHAIILIDAMLRIREAHPTMPTKDVVLEASTTRLRPIVLTTLTTAIGMLPLLTVSILWAPLAATILSGMVFSLILTLVTVPVMALKFPGKMLRPREA